MDKQLVWVVSGAGESIGPATVQYLLLRGQTVVAMPSSFTDREADLKAYQERFPAADIRLANIFHSPDTKNAVCQIVEQYGAIDKLINIGDGGLLSLYVLLAMRKAGKGHIIQFLDEHGGYEDGPLTTDHSLLPEPGEAGGVLFSLIEPGLFFQYLVKK